MQQYACLVINSITVDNFFCTLESHAGGSGVRFYDGPNIKLCIIVGWDWSVFVCCLVYPGSTDDLRLLQIYSGVVWRSRDRQLSYNTLCLLSPRFASS